jgi:hypothetical protein
MRTNIDYSSDFEQVWDCYKIACHPASFGSKSEAFREWVKLKPQPIVSELLESIRIEKSNDRYRKQKNIFCPAWKHFCRWIKYRCWESIVEIKEPETQKKYYQPKPIPVETVTGNIADEFKTLIQRKVK